MMIEVIKILLIDDDELDQISFKRSMSRSALETEIFFAGDSDEAFRILEKESFHIIFLDYLLPKMDGLDMMKTIRNKGVTCPIIIVTSQGDERIAVDLMKAGASDYIVKDLLNTDGLTLAIRNALRYQQTIAEKKEIEIELIKSERRFRQMVETATDIIYRTNAKGYFTYLNPVVVNRTGYNEKELLGKHFTDLVDASMREEVKTFYEEQFNKKLESSYREFIVLKKNGDKMWVGQNLQIISSDQHEILGFFAVVRDITKRKAIEEELIKAKREAEESAKIKEQFLANVSHEIRTPMNAIIGFADLLFKTSLNEQQKEYLHAIRHSGDNLLVLINDILDFSKLSANKIVLENISYNLEEVVEDTILGLEIKAAEKGLDFSFFIEHDVPHFIKGDPYRLNQILLNLLSNAVKFTDKGFVRLNISVTITQESSYLCFQVQDSGIGIPPEKVDNIFQLFTQASSDTTRRYGGTGLGLSIVKSLVELQGGRIGVRSEPGKGSVFHFVLPLTVGEKMGEPQRRKAAEVSSLKRRLKILLAEDNELNRKLALAVLNDANIEVDIAENGKVAVQKLEKGTRYDLVLMDIQMPEMDGYTAASYIRSRLKGDTRNIPIIAMTAHALEGEKEKCFKAGMNDYISKPFREEDLLQKIMANAAHEVICLEGTVPDTKENTAPYEWIDLAYLESLTRGNKEFKAEMISTFIEQEHSFLKAMDQYLAAGDWNNLGYIAHKFRSSVSVIRIKNVEEVLLSIEKNCIKTTDLDRNKELLEKVRSLCAQGVRELKREMWQLTGSAG